MSTNQVTATVKDAWESLKELLEKTESQVRKEISQAAPMVRRSIGGSIETATEGFDSAMKDISNHTAREQLELLKAYHRFLAGQIGFVELRLGELEQQTKTQLTEMDQEEIWKATQRAFWFPSDADI